MTVQANIANPWAVHLGCFIRDFAHGMARIGHRMKFANAYEPVCRHINTRPFRYFTPMITDAAFVAPNALLVGNVVLGHGASVYYGAVVRNHSVVDATVIGDHTTVGDRTTLNGQLKIGNNCVIGIGCSLDSCTLHDNVYIGHGAVVCLGAEIESGAIIAAGAVVPQDTRVGAGEIWAGADAEKVDNVSSEQASEVAHLAHDAAHHAAVHQKSIKALYAKNSEFNLEWLKAVQHEAEEQQKNIAVSTGADIPLEARRFVQPRVQHRRMDQNLRNTSSISNAAPWVPRDIASQFTS
jgi:carbonic anhydrase/acetyltransferase-like protein (isoleucine patch superfamily)